MARIQNRNQIDRLFKPFKMTRLDILLVLLPALLWPVLVLNRSAIIDTKCTDISRCQPASIPAIDQPGYYIENPGADLYSYYSQNASGGVLLAGILSAFVAKAPFAIVLSHLIIAIEVTLWNGTVTESVRLLFQRPRPFVYHNPSGEGAWHANYVSFYSGHTSFAMAANLILFLLLLSRRASVPALLLSFLVGQGLVFCTAVYRILAGRHFISDVLAGMLGATCVVFMITWYHPRQFSSQPEPDDLLKGPQ